MHGNIVLKRIFQLKRDEIFTRWVASKSFVSAFVKLRKATVGFVISVRPYPIIWFPMDGFSRIFIPDIIFWKIYLRNFRTY